MPAPRQIVGAGLAEDFAARVGQDDCGFWASQDVQSGRDEPVLQVFAEEVRLVDYQDVLALHVTSG